MNNKKQQLITKFGIHIKSSNIEESYKFYKLFGLNEIFAYGNEEWREKMKDKCASAPENYRGVTFDIGGSLLEVAEGHIAVKPEVFKESITSSKISAMVHVVSVDEVEKICKANNLDIAVPIKEFPWGTREVVVRDPDGFILVFIERIEK